MSSQKVWLNNNDNSIVWFMLLVLIISTDLTDAALSSPFGKYLHNTSHHTVHVSVISITDNHTNYYPIHTLQDLNLFRMLVFELSKSVEIVLEFPSNFFTIYVRRNENLITKGFIQKYFSKSNKPIVKKVDVSDQTHSRCYFIEDLSANTSSTTTSLNLCNGVEGIVEIFGKLYSLQPVINKSKVLHNLFEHKIVSSNQSKTCDQSQNGSFEKTKDRYLREIHPPPGHNIDTRYIELYVVVDYALYRRTGSVDSSIKRAVELANFASALLGKLNVFIALVGVEVWNTGDKVQYESDGVNDDGEEQYKMQSLLSSLSDYRSNTLLPQLPHDSTFLFSGRLFAELGRAHIGSICQRKYSAGVVKDYENEWIPIVPASTLAHEIGHNLGINHIKSDKECECSYPDDPDNKKCIMAHSGSSKY